MQDLSPGDLKKVRQLALIDMTALSDLLELEVKRQKMSKRKIAGRLWTRVDTHSQAGHAHTLRNIHTIYAHAHTHTHAHTHKKSIHTHARHQLHTQPP